MGELEDLRRHIAFKRDGERSLVPEIAAHMLTALDAGAAPDYQVLLREARWPAPPRFVFHTASTGARDAIANVGLRSSQPGAAATDAPWPDPDRVWASQTVGVYVAEQPDVDGRWTRWEHWDVWRVDVDGLEWRADPLNPRCWVITGDVSADRLQLASTHGVSAPARMRAAHHQGGPSSSR